jgi:hypothetical protein
MARKPVKEVKESEKNSGAQSYITDVTSLLGTDVRIIAEDDEHAVIAVRVEKAWLRRNHRFLDSLSVLVRR